MADHRAVDVIRAWPKIVDRKIDRLAFVDVIRIGLFDSVSIDLKAVIVIARVADPEGDITGRYDRRHVNLELVELHLYDRSRGGFDHTLISCRSLRAPTTCAQKQNNEGTQECAFYKVQCTMCHRWVD